MMRAASGASNRYLQTYKSILRLAFPIIVGQLGAIVVGFADNIMVGRYSTAALASASFVNNVYSMAMFCTLGFTYGILPLVGALYAQGEKRSIGALMRSATIINIIYALAVSLVMCGVYLALDRLGQPTELLPLIRPYFLLSLAGILPVAMFSAYAQWSYGVKNTVAPMWIVLFTNVLNVAGNYLLIYGKFGCPEMGLTGAGISTLVARVASMVAMMGYFFLKRRNADYKDGFFDYACKPSSIGSVWRISIPISMQMTCESGSFSVAAVMAGWLGAISLAAYQIIVIVGMLGFTLYYGIGSAIAVLVSNEAGKGDAKAMRHAGWAGYHVMLALAACSTLAFVFLSRPLMHLFTEDMAVLSAALCLIFPLVLYQLGDATQIAFSNALRGTSNVMPMLWIAFGSYIVLGVPATYVLGFPCHLGLYGIVLSFSVSLFTAGSLFLTFFLLTTRKKVGM